MFCPFLCLAVKIKHEIYMSWPRFVLGNCFMFYPFSCLAVKIKHEVYMSWPRFVLRNCFMFYPFLCLASQNQTWSLHELAQICTGKLFMFYPFLCLAVKIKPQTWCLYEAMSWPRFVLGNCLMFYPFLCLAVMPPISSLVFFQETIKNCGDSFFVVLAVQKYLNHKCSKSQI